MTDYSSYPLYARGESKKQRLARRILDNAKVQLLDGNECNACRDANIPCFMATGLINCAHCTAKGGKGRWQCSLNPRYQSNSRQQSPHDEEQAGLLSDDDDDDAKEEHVGGEEEEEGEGGKEVEDTVVEHWGATSVMTTADKKRKINTHSDMRRSVNASKRHCTEENTSAQSGGQSSLQPASEKIKDDKSSVHPLCARLCALASEVESHINNVVETIFWDKLDADVDAKIKQEIHGFKEQLEADVTSLVEKELRTLTAKVKNSLQEIAKESESSLQETSEKSESSLQEVTEKLENGLSKMVENMESSLQEIGEKIDLHAKRVAAANSVAHSNSDRLAVLEAEMKQLQLQGGQGNSSSSSGRVSGKGEGSGDGR